MNACSDHDGRARGVLLRHVTSPLALEAILRHRRFVAFSGSPLNADSGANFFNECTRMGPQRMAGYGATLICRWTGPIRVVGASPLPPFSGDEMLDMNPWKVMVPVGARRDHLVIVGFSLRSWALDDIFDVERIGWLPALERLRARQARERRLAYRRRLHQLLHLDSKGLQVVAP